MQAAHTLLGYGFVPFIPHLNWFMSLQQNREEAFWLYEFDFYWLVKCDVILRLPGESKGADAEVAFALDREIPVFYSIDDLRAFYKK